MDSGGLSHFMGMLKDKYGEPEPPYTEVEWVESNGKQYVYLDWKPKIATWGFEADFISYNATNSSVGAWNATTNKSGYGSIFSVRSATNAVNQCSLSSYGGGTLRIGAGNVSGHGFKTDNTRQQMKLHGTIFTKPNGTTMTVTRVSETVDKPYCNMTIFAMHEGLRRTGTGSLVEPGSVRIYSLKFYDSDTLECDLVGAIRKSDGVTGLYDKVAGKFYPAPGCTYGNVVGDLGDPTDIASSLGGTVPYLVAYNDTNTRMLRVNAPTLDKLEDGQTIRLTILYAPSASVQTTELAGWDDTGNNTYVYVKLTLSDGSTTEWIPCFYNAGTRLTTHYYSGIPLILTYRENVFYSATATSSGTTIMRGFWVDQDYNTNTTANRYSDSVIAGVNGVGRYTLCMRDASDSWTKIVNENNKAGLSDKTAYVGGLKLGKVVYHNSGSDITAGSATGAMEGSSIAADIRYSLNGISSAAASTTLQLRKPVYLVGTVNSTDGLFYLDQTKWWTQELPIAEDGKVYILIGWAYSSYYAVIISEYNPAYVYKNGHIHELVNGHIVQKDVPADAAFTDTTYSAGTGLSLSGTTFSNSGVTGVKGNAESSYRTGDVNLTPANIGAVALSGNETVAGNKTLSGTTTAYNIKVGQHVQSDTTVRNQGIEVLDVRNAPLNANSLNKKANFFFTNNDVPVPNTWWSLLHVKGWEGAYTAWELAGPSNNTNNKKTPLYVRTSDASNVWSPWRALAEVSMIDEVYSRGEQLIVNGNGFMGDNTNFSSWTFDGSVANNSKGSFTRTPSSATIVVDDSIPVDPSKSYAIEFDVKCGTDASLPAGAKMYAFLNYYDVDGLQVGYYHGIYHRANTTTTLAQDLKNGDTVVYFTDLTNWWVGTTADHQRSFIFWDYTNSFGYTYPPNTYSRHEAHAVYASNDSVNKTNNTITLLSAWNGGTVPAGTKVSQNASGGNYDYVWNHTTQSTFPIEWKHVKSIRHPENMWKGVATVKVGFLWNYGYTTSAKQQQIWVTNLSMRAIDAECESLGFGKLISYGSDLNSIVEVGEYHIDENANVASITNKPSGLTNAFTLIVSYALSYRNTTYILQELTEFQYGRKWRRLSQNSGTSWGSWLNSGGFDVVPVANGGTGQTTAVNAANSFLNALSTGSSDPQDADYYISQYVGGGSTTTTYHRRPMSALWNYIRSKISSVLGLTSTQYGGNAATATSATTAGNITGTVAIANGGTGATTAETAWTALGGGAIGKKASLVASDIPAHASTTTNYGVGNASNYGHLKLSASTSSTSGESAGIAATPSAVKSAYDLANTANGTANSALSLASGALYFDTTYTVANGTATFSAHVYSGGEEVTADYAATDFTWYYRLGATASTVSLGTGKTKDVTITTLGYGGSVGCTFDDGK